MPDKQKPDQKQTDRKGSEDVSDGESTDLEGWARVLEWRSV